MPVYVIDTVKPKNGLDFPVVEAIDVAVEGYLNLADAVTHFATQSALAELNAAINGKADTADLTAATANLQAQIDQLITPVTQDAEVQNARVSSSGRTYNTLKQRLDDEFEKSVAARYASNTSERTSFDDYIESGLYLINSTLTNAPDNISEGELATLNWNTSSGYGGMQMFTSRYNKTYIRILWGSIWSAWACLSVEGRLDNIEASITALGESIDDEIESLSNNVKHDIDRLMPYLSKTDEGNVENQLTFPNNGNLTSTGEINSDSDYQTTGYIDLTDVVGIYRTGSTAKYSLYRQAFYDGEQEFLSYQDKGTDYEYETYDGKQVTWIPLNVNAKYIRLSNAKTSPFTYYVVRKHYLYNLPYVTFEGNDLLASVNDGTDAKEKVDSITETQIGVNKFNPEWLEKTSYYYDFNDGETHVMSASVLTPEYIELPENCNDIYLMSTDSTVGTAGLYFWNGENYISFQSYSLASMYNVSLHITLPTGTTRIKFWANDKNMLGTQLCMDYEPISEFVAYEEKLVVKESALPEINELPLKGKTIVNFGDSIFGNYRKPVDISTEIEKRTGATVINCGFGGCRMSQHNMATYDKFCMYRLAYSIANNDWTLQDAAIADPEWPDKPSYFASSLSTLKSIDFSEVDAITIAYGTNDFMSDVRLDNEQDPYDITRYKGALRYSIEQILGAFPNVRIIVCTPIYRSWNRDGSFYEDSNTKTDSYFKTLIDFGTACKEVCQEYNMQCIDNYYIGMGRYNRDYYWTSPDYTHPNINGRKLIGDHISNELY